MTSDAINIDLLISAVRDMVRHLGQSSLVLCGVPPEQVEFELSAIELEVLDVVPEDVQCVSNEWPYCSKYWATADGMSYAPVRKLKFKRLLFYPVGFV